MPISLLLRSRVPRKQKLALAGIFSLTLLITLFSIIRFVLNGPWRGVTSPSWIGTWSTIEQSVSVIVACLASFRTWVITNNRSTDHRSYERQREAGTLEGGRQRIMIGQTKDKFGFLSRSYGGSSSRPEGSMDIELLDSQRGLGVGAPAQAHVMRGKGEEPSAVNVTPMGKKGLDAV